MSGAFRKGQFQILPLNKTDEAHRGLLWADVNGDGRPDLLVAEPDSGQVSVYLQNSDGSLAPPKTFPALAGVTQIAVSDWNGDGAPEIFLLSRDENAVGVTQFDKDGRLPFPTLLPLDGKPLVMAVGALKPGATPTLAIIVDKDGRRSLVTRTSDGVMKSQKLSDSFKADPTTMAVQDVNQDGLSDLVVLMPYEKIKVLLQKPGGDFDEEDVDPPGGAIEQPWLASADVDGDGKPELLLPQKNFVRAVVLERGQKIPGSTNQPGWVFRVKDQINGAESDSQITGATAIRNGTNATPSIFLLDAQYNQLSLCERDTNGVWQIVRNVDLPVTDFNSIQPVALGGHGRAERGVSRTQHRRVDAAVGGRVEFDRAGRLRNTHQGRLFERRGGGRFQRPRAEGFGVHGNRQKLSGHRRLRFKPQARARQPLAGFRAAHLPGQQRLHA